MMGIGQPEPVHIRVDSIDPIPPADASPSLLVRVTFEVLDPPRFRSYQLPSVWVVPYVEALQGAIASRAVYWVDLDYTKLPAYPPPGIGDSIPLRILKAVQNQQRVGDQDEPGDDDRALE
jgi:hypothetical protein